MKPKNVLTSKKLKKLALNKKVISQLRGGVEKNAFKTSEMPTCPISTPASCWK